MHFASPSPRPSPLTAAASARANVVLRAEDADRLWVFPESEESLGSGGEFHIYLDAETHPRARAAFAKFDLGPGGAPRSMPPEEFARLAAEHDVIRRPAAEE